MGLPRATGGCAGPALPSRPAAGSARAGPLCRQAGLRAPSPRKHDIMTRKAGRPHSRLHAADPLGPHPPVAGPEDTHHPSSGKEAETPRSSWTGQPSSGRGRAQEEPLSPTWVAVRPCIPSAGHPGKGEPRGRAPGSREAAAIPLPQASLIARPP